MLKLALLLLALMLPRAAFAQQPPSPAPVPQMPPPAERIADNSFLLEEAYNQEFGVVQHINAFFRNNVGRQWVYSFTQEWPINPAPRHQFSYTLTVTNSPDFPGSGTGFGDLLINWRYQLVGDGDARVAFAPRVSLLVPSGRSRFGRGVGATGVQLNLPVSVLAAEKLAIHLNAGATLVPHAKNEVGHRAGSHSVNLGQSFVWLVHPRANLLLETLYLNEAAVIAPGLIRREQTVILNPAIRWAHNFTSGLQIVPGIGFPVNIPATGRAQWGIFLYLSFEHPFKRGLTK